VEVAVSRKQEFYQQIDAIKKATPKNPAQSVKAAPLTQETG
jgi:hypothetical protein